VYYTTPSAKRADNILATHKKRLCMRTMASNGLSAAFAANYEKRVIPAKWRKGIDKDSQFC
jgi:hypothetical protein